MEIVGFGQLFYLKMQQRNQKKVRKQFEKFF